MRPTLEMLANKYKNDQIEIRKMSPTLVGVKDLVTGFELPIPRDMVDGTCASIINERKQQPSTAKHTPPPQAPSKKSELQQHTKKNVEKPTTKGDDKTSSDTNKSFVDLSEKVANTNKPIDVMEQVLDWLNSNASVTGLNLNGIPLKEQGVLALVKFLVKNKSLIAIDIRNTDIDAKQTRILVAAVKRHPKICIFHYSEDFLVPHLTAEETLELRSFLISRQKNIAPSSVFTMPAPDISTPSLGLVQYQQAIEKWRISFKGIANLEKKVEELHHNYMGKMLLDHQPFNSLQYDLAIIKDLSNSVSESDKSAFTNHAQGILRVYSAQVHTVQGLVGGDAFVPLANELNKAVGIIDKGKDVAKEIETVLKTVGSFVNENSTSKNIISVTEKLFKDVGTISSESLKLTELKDKLFLLSNDPNCDKSQILVIKNQIQLQQKKLEEFASRGFTFQSLSQGFDALGPVLNIAGVSPSLANQVVTVGKASVSIGENIGKIIAGGAVLGPIGFIAGGIAAIFSIFNSGPSNEERMLTQISEQMDEFSQHVDYRFNDLQVIICQGINQLGQHIDQRFESMEKAMLQGFNHMEKAMLQGFNHIEKVMLQGFGEMEQVLRQHFEHAGNVAKAIAEHQDKRFDILEGMLDKIYVDCMKGFSQLGKDLTSINKGVKNLDQKLGEVRKIIEKIGLNIDRIEGKIDHYAKEHAEKDYRHIKRQAFDVFVVSPREQDAVKHAGELAEWSIGTSKSYALSDKQDDKESHLQVCDRILERGPFSINLLMTCLKWINEGMFDKCKIHQGEGFANPQIWIDATRSYMRFIWQCMALERKKSFSLYQSGKFDEISAKNINEIKKIGQQLKDFIYAIKSNQDFFIQLCDNYRKCLHNVIDAKGNRGVSLFGGETSDFNLFGEEKTSLSLNPQEEFAVAYRLLHIFTAMAFQQDYMQDPTLRSYLHIQLWGEKELEYYLNVVSDNDTFVLSTVKNRLLRAIDAFEELIFEKVAIAAQDPKKLTGYSLLDTTLQEIEIFSDILSAYKPAVQLQQAHSSEVSNTFSIEDFKKKLSNLIESKSFIFNLTRPSASEMIISFDDDATSSNSDEIREELRNLTACLKQGLESMSLPAANIVSQKLKEKKVIISCDVETLNRIGELLESVGSKYFKDKDQASKVLFFKPEPSQKKGDPKSEINCRIQ